MTPLIRVGHKGADLIAPGNTLESFDAALAHGVDMIEFDVLPERYRDRGGRLLLAHDYHDARRRDPLTLEEGLDHLAAPAFSGLELDVDLKLPGYESRVVAALREHGLVERALVSSQYVESLDAIRREPSRACVSAGRSRRPGATTRARRCGCSPRSACSPPCAPGAAQAARDLRTARIDAVMSHWRLVTPALISAVREGGRRALRLDRRRAAAHPRARGARRHRRHHERPAPVPRARAGAGAGPRMTQRAAL